MYRINYLGLVFRIGDIIADIIAFLYIGAIATLLVLYQSEFIYLTKTYPYPMGFLKVACLATFGEMLKNRRLEGSWSINRPLWRFLAWGLFGLWFTAAFPMIAMGVQGLIDKGLWWQVDGWWLAFSKSLWINVLGGYAFSMMLTHEYFNKAIERGRIISLTSFAECMAGTGHAKVWFRFIPLTIFIFWVSMHTITFMLPPHYYVLFAATLSIALGFILTFKK